MLKSFKHHPELFRDLTDGDLHEIWRNKFGMMVYF
jgi:hypothetical protein